MISRKELTPISPLYKPFTAKRLIHNSRLFLQMSVLFKRLLGKYSQFLCSQKKDFKIQLTFSV